jgi:lactobin A/cerein 7B family class IIb bacteriocin
LENLGVQELDAREIKETNGGIEPVSFIVGAIAGGIIFEAWRGLVKKHLDGTIQYHVPGYGMR